MVLLLSRVRLPIRKHQCRSLNYSISTKDSALYVTLYCGQFYSAYFRMHRFFSGVLLPSFFLSSWPLRAPTTSTLGVSSQNLLIF